MYLCPKWKNSYINTKGYGKFINHSCEPNSGFKSSDTLIAIRDIRAGEEITFDYSTSMDEDDWTMKCNCGSKSCRGIIKDFKYLPRNIQEYYIKREIVPQWIIDSISLQIPLSKPKNLN